MKSDSGPGVPEAIPRVLMTVYDRVGVEEIDRLWLFPPLVKGRREWGLIVASCTGSEDDQRRLVTASYYAETTGTGTTIEPSLFDEGEAPADRVPRVIDGVVRRSAIDGGDPREVEIGGETQRFLELLHELDPEGRVVGTFTTRAGEAREGESDAALEATADR